MTIEHLMLFTVLGCFIVIAAGIVLIRKDIEELKKELYDKRGEIRDH